MNASQVLRERNLQMCMAQGLKVSKHGEAWRVLGRGVDFSICDLRFIQPLDLQPSYQSTR